MLAALYCRVSTEEQGSEGFSIPAQIKALKEYCLKNGIDIYNEYVDIGISGTKEDRPQFQKMINEADKFDIILVHKFDRFARKIELSHRIKAQLKKHSVNVISITEPVEDSPIGFFQEGLLELLAEYYVRNLSKEVKKGHVERASQGLYNGSLPYGYYAKEGKLYIKEDEAKIIRLIYDMYLSGKGVQKISYYLQENRIMTQHNKIFQYYQVWRILQNPKYIGLIEYDGQLYEGQHEPIITKEQFNMVKKELTKRNYNPNAGKSGRAVQRSKNYYRWHMIDILYCGECGGKMRIIYHVNKSGTWQSYSYVCSRAMRYKNYCTNSKNYKAIKLENEISNILHDFMLNKSDIDFEIEKNKDTTINEILENRKIKIKTELDRAKKAYLAGIFELDEFTDIKNSLTQELEELKKETKPNTNNRKNEKKLLRQQLKTIWDEYTTEQDVCKKRSLLKNIINSITIYADGSVKFCFWGNV